jgi:hypothetical protein
MRVEVSWLLPLQQQQDQEIIIDEQDLKTLAGVIHQDGFIRIHGVAKIRTSFVPRSRLTYFDQKSNSISVLYVVRTRVGESWRLPLQQQDQDIIINDHDLKIMVGVIRQEGFIRYRGVAKIRTFASRSGLLRA